MRRPLRLSPPALSLRKRIPPCQRACAIRRRTSRASMEMAPSRCPLCRSMCYGSSGNSPELPQFNLPFAYRLQGPLNVPALERSLAEVVRRHDSLRTAFALAGRAACCSHYPSRRYQFIPRRRRSCSQGASGAGRS